MKILVTGGAGYIGSITNQILRASGHDTVVFDNLVNGHKEAVGDTLLVVGDLTKKADIEAVFKAHTFDAVVHFAALALAGESMERPYDYYINNVLGGLNLLEAMRTHGCTSFVFSSSCSVYGTPQTLPVSENAPIHPESVYAATKRMVEEYLDWFQKIYGISYVSLRYFNAAGASIDGRLGENHPFETHIIPIALDVAYGRRPLFEIYGNDYKTPDGTCIRDYIHVVDLADAHVRALSYLHNNKPSVALNLGVGKGYSNNQIIEAVEKVTGKKINKTYKERRSGDPASIYADNKKAKSLLGWEPKCSDIETIIASANQWYVRHNNL